MSDPVIWIEQELQGRWVTESIRYELERKKAAILRGRRQNLVRVPYQQSLTGSLKWAIIEVATGETVYISSVVNHPDLGRVETFKRNFKTKTEALTYCNEAT